MTTSSAGPVNTAKCPHAKLKTLPFANVTLNDGFWLQKQKTNREVSLQHGYDELEKRGTFTNFMLVTGKIKGEWQGHPSRDSDLYKWIEAVAWEIAVKPNRHLEKLARESIDLIAQAQGEDGYVSTYYQYVHPEKRWTDIEWGHEIYMAGHLIQAAVAWKRSTGKDEFLRVARRFADCIDKVFGYGKKDIVCGHPQIEMALVELYRETGEKRYLDLANYFIDRRGYKTLKPNWYGSWYFVDRVPLRESQEIEGHAVRALYFNAGAADAYMESGDKGILNGLNRQWNDMVTRKMYITGGVGSRHDGEAFGAPYELPNDRAYCETCASIGVIMWAWRMLLITGEARFADIMEREFFNGFLSGVSLDGKKFLYTDPLLDLGQLERQDWYSCACCPPNIMRTFSSLQHYLVTENDVGVQIHQYTASNIKTCKGNLKIETCYPWDGNVKMGVETIDSSSWKLALRIPSWSTKTKLRVNGKPVAIKMKNGYAVVERKWKSGDIVELDIVMTPRLTMAHPLVDTNRNRVAIERGPFVFCLEQADYPKSVNVLNTEIDATKALKAQWSENLLGGIMTITAQGNAVNYGKWKNELYLPSIKSKSKKIKLTAIPFYARLNRGKSPMIVWLPKARG